MDISSGKLQILEPISKTFQNGYILGTNNTGGGYIGAIIATPLVKLLGTVGATAVIITAIIMLLIIIFKISPTEYLANTITDIQTLKKEKAEKIEAEKQALVPEFKLQSEKQEKRGMFSFLSNLSSKVKNKKQIYDVEKDGGVGNENSNVNYNEKLLSGEMPPLYEMEEWFDEGKQNSEKIEAEKKQMQKIGKAVFTEVTNEKEVKTKEVMNLNSDEIKYEDYEYVYPPLELLEDGPAKSKTASKQMIEETANKLQKTLYSFGVSAKVMDVSVGPAITRYELKPAVGVKVSKISNLVDDIALNLAAETIRIEAPIPGKQAVGIELPNEKREMVVLKDIIASDEFKESKSKISFALGKGVGGDNIMADIYKMPHLLVAGSTGSRKVSMYKLNNYKYCI